MLTCPKCNSPLDFEEDELDIGDEFTCEECGANVRVADTDPIEFESAEDDDDDEDDDDAFDEDDEDEDEDEDLEEEEDNEDEW